jgi:hypothetical protein
MRSILLRFIESCAECGLANLSQMMKSIFGGAPTAAPAARSPRASESPHAPPGIAEILRESAKNVLKTSKVTETKIFAGQSVTLVYLLHLCS